jgi:hypothetical protein
MDERKGGIMAALSAGAVLLGAKGCAIIAKVAGSGVDDAARAASHLAPAADDAVRGAASVATHGSGIESAHLAEEATKAAASLGEHSSSLVDDGSKLVRPRPQKGMSDMERIERSAQDVIRRKLKEAGRDDDDDDGKSKPTAKGAR